MKLSMMVAIAILFIAEAGNTQPIVLERIHYLKANGKSYLQYQSLKTDVPSINAGIPKGKDPATYYQYLFPNEYEFERTNYSHADLLKFQGSNYSSIVEDEFSPDELTIDENGVYTYSQAKKGMDGHYGVYWSDHYGRGFSKLAYVWIIPEDFEFISYDVNREGEWVERGNSLSFFGEDVNDLLFKIKYQKKKRTPDTFLKREVKVKKRLTFQSSHPVLKVRDNEKVDGDIISISLNGEWIAKGLKVTNNEVEIELDLKKGNNYLIMYAENEGEIPPNTAAMKVGGQEVILNSSPDKSEALELIVD